MTNYCQPCEYRTEIKRDYERHLTSALHVKLKSISQLVETNTKTRTIEELNLKVMCQEITIQNLLERAERAEALVQQAARLLGFHIQQKKFRVNIS